MAIQDKRNATSGQNLWGWAEDDLIYGSAYADILAGGQGNDVIYGGGGNDTIRDWTIDFLGQVHEDGNDDFYGGSGNDTIFGGSGDDRLFGEGNNDRIAGGTGNDLVMGGSGNDRLDGGQGDDVIDGGSGDDTVRLNWGNDTIFGGIGRDTLSFTAGTDGNVPVSFGTSVVDFNPIGRVVGHELDLETGFRRVLGETGSMTFAVGIQDFEIFEMGSGWDILRADDSIDDIRGGAGHDLIEGRGGADIINGQDGFDTASYESSGAAVNIDLGRITQLGGDAAGDQLFNIEAAIGSALGDRLVGSNVSNRLEGRSGNDVLFGRDGLDQLVGGAGADRLDGGSDDDIITGGTGIDILTGGSGEDIFIFQGLGDFRPDLTFEGIKDGTSNTLLISEFDFSNLTLITQSRETITDFEVSVDEIYLSNIDANTNLAGDQAFSAKLVSSFTGLAGQLRIVYEGSGDARQAIVSGDVNGDTKADFTLAVTVGNGLLGDTDFLL